MARAPSSGSAEEGEAVVGEVRRREWRVRLMEEEEVGLREAQERRKEGTRKEGMWGPARWEGDQRARRPGVVMSAGR